MTTPDRTKHDRRCEAVVPGLQGRSMMGCRCARRNEVRTLSVELSNGAAVSNETLAMVAVEALDIMGTVIERLMRGLRVSLEVHERELIPTSLQITTASDSLIEGVAITVEALTLPLGSLHDDAVLEVAADWVARKYRLRA